MRNASWVRLALTGLLLASGQARAGAQNAGPADRQIGAYELAYPFPSPDGAAVAFQANFEGRWQLYVMRLDSGATTRIHASDGDDTHPAFSPDGSRLAFISNRDGNDEVYVLTLATGIARAVSPHPGKDGHPKWSRDGRWIVFNRTFDPADREGDRDSAILRVRPDGSGLEVLSDSPHVETFPSFSPDGRRIAFVEWFPGESEQARPNGDIVLVDLATRARTNVTRSPEFDGYPYWADDGWLYFSAAVEGGPAGGEALVQRIRPDGSGRERLTAIDGMSEVRAIPDARALFFNRTVDDRTLLFRMELSPPSQ